MPCLKFPPPIEQSLASLPAPAGAWALAKAAYETAHELNFAEQREAMRRATADDPEPPDVFDERWRPWSDRNQARIQEATAPIRARYPENLRRLLEAAEKNMVDWAEEEFQRHDPKAFLRIAPVFKAYREGLLYGDNRELFLNVCFRTPAR